MTTTPIPPNDQFAAGRMSRAWPAAVIVAISFAVSLLALPAILVSMRAVSTDRSTLPAHTPRLGDIVQQLANRPSIFGVQADPSLQIDGASDTGDDGRPIRTVPTEPGQPLAPSTPADPPICTAEPLPAPGPHVAPDPLTNPPRDVPHVDSPAVETNVPLSEEPETADYPGAQELPASRAAETDIKAAIASATEALMGRIRQLEERLEAARTQDPKYTEAADAVPQDGRSQEAPLVETTPISAPVPAPQGLLAPPPTAAVQPPPASPSIPETPPARSLGVEVAAGARCGDRHCQGLHLRVTAVSPDSPATRTRCRDCGRTVSLAPGDVIIRANSKSVWSVEALRDALNQSPGPVVLHVMQSGRHKDLEMR